MKSHYSESYAQFQKRTLCIWYRFFIIRVTMWIYDGNVGLSVNQSTTLVHTEASQHLLDGLP